MHERRSCGNIKECMQRNNLLRKPLAAEDEEKLSIVLTETRTSKLNVLTKACFFCILRNDQT